MIKKIDAKRQAIDIWSYIPLLAGLHYNTSVPLKIKPRANGRNIVGQQLPTLLDVTCCIRLLTL